MTSHVEDDLGRDGALRALLVEQVRTHAHRSRVASVVLTVVDSVWFLALVVFALSRPTMPQAIAAAALSLIPAALTLWLINRVEHAPVVDFLDFRAEEDDFRS